MIIQSQHIVDLPENKVTTTSTNINNNQHTIIQSQYMVDLPETQCTQDRPVYKYTTDSQWIAT